MNIADFELFLLDMDGTLYLGDSVIEGAVKAVQLLREKKRVCFLTNNSSKSRKTYFDKLTRLGFCPDIDEIYTSGNSAIRYLNKNFSGKNVFLLGTDALKEEFLAEGIKLTESTPDIVAVAYDTGLNYERLSKACIFIRNGCGYISTHPDINCPAPNGYLPDVGSFIELIKASADRYPDAICGKPYNLMAEAVAERFQVGGRIVMVGDRLSTDIRFAANNGFGSILVLTGETNIKMHDNSAIKSNFVLNSIADIVKYL